MYIKMSVCDLVQFDFAWFGLFFSGISTSNGLFKTDMSLIYKYLIKIMNMFFNVWLQLYFNPSFLIG